MLNFEFLEKGLGIVFPLHFLSDFFLILKGLLVIKNNLRPKSVPSKELVTLY